MVDQWLPTKSVVSVHSSGPSEAVVTWGTAEDVLLYHKTPDRNATIYIGMTWQQARELAEQLHRASLQAEELDKGYADFMAGVGAPPDSEEDPF